MRGLLGQSRIRLALADGEHERHWCVILAAGADPRSLDLFREARDALNKATVQMFLAHATPLMADRYRMAAVPKHLRDAAVALGEATSRTRQRSRTRRAVGSRKRGSQGV